MKSGNTLQLSLFQPATSPTSNIEKVEWSYTRRSTLNQCARKYYYEYYGANKNTAVQEPIKQELHRLKQLQNRYERTGFILHLMLSHYLKKAQKGTVLSLEGLMRWATKIFREDLEYSVSTQINPGPEVNAPYPPVGLTEFYLGFSNAEQLCREAFSRMQEGLVGFFQSPAIARFRCRGIEPNALIEATIKLADFPCRIDGRVDLVCPSEAQVEVVDWKSGEYDGAGDDSLQLAVYALWTRERFNCLQDQLHIYKAYPGSGEVVEFSIDNGVFEATRARIIQDAEQMAELAKYGEAGIAEAFSPCGHTRVCDLCPYSPVCPKEV